MNLVEIKPPTHCPVCSESLVWLKDILYCDSLSSKKRKNCVKVLNIILESLLKWFAPILVFTTDEIFSLLEKNKNIHE